MALLTGNRFFGDGDFAFKNLGILQEIFRQTCVEFHHTDLLYLVFFLCHILKTDFHTFSVNLAFGTVGEAQGSGRKHAPFCSFEEIRCSIGELKRFARMKLYRVAFLPRKPD